jgi:hypothetical protein
MSTNEQPFKTMALLDVPHSRNGKHRKIVSQILRNLDQLKDGAAFKVPLAALGDTKENVRSALSRVARKSNRKIGTAADENFLYVWNISNNSNNGVKP